METTMPTICENIQSQNWKTEKHVPVIECSDTVTGGEVFPVTVTLGKEIAHPNTTEHHIRWIQLFFKPQGDKFTYQVANVEFTAHGEAAAGANQGPVHTHHSVTANVKVSKPGTFYALAYCNIHGMWQNAKEIKVS